MKKEKVIEVNLGVGMNMLFPEPIQIVIDDTFEKRYKKYLKFVKTTEEPDYDYLMDDPNQNKVREFTFEEFVEVWENNINLQKRFNKMDKKIKEEDLWCEYSDLPSPKAYIKCADYDSMGNHGRFPMVKQKKVSGLKNLLKKIMGRFKKG